MKWITATREFADRVARATGISEVDVRRFRPVQTHDAFEVQLWNHRRVVVTRYRLAVG